VEYWRERGNTRVDAGKALHLLVSEVDDGWGRVAPSDGPGGNVRGQLHTQSRGSSAGAQRMGSSRQKKADPTAYLRSGNTLLHRRTEDVAAGGMNLERSRLLLEEVKKHLR